MNLWRTVAIGLVVAVVSSVAIGPAKIATAQAPEDAAAVAEWNPANTWVFAVGVLNFEESGMGGWPQEGRKDAELIATLRRRGVADERIVFLTDNNAKLNRIRRSFDEFIAKPDESATVIVYFTGHGATCDAGTMFTPFDYNSNRPAQTGWAVKSIFDTIDAKFRGTRAVLLADCCYSGALAVEAANRADSRVSYACFSSAWETVISTDNWTFTECLIAGFGGAGKVDGNRDGHILLGELADYSERHMAFTERQLSKLGTTGCFAQPFKLAVTADRPAAEVGNYVMATHGERTLRAQIIGVDGDRVQVHFLDVNAGDQWVTRAQIQPWNPETFAAGTAVEVRWKGDWYPGHVIVGRFGLHFISYDGYDESWHEWVGPARIRARGATDGDADNGE